VTNSAEPIDDVSRQQRFDNHVEKHLRRNIAAQLANGMFGQTGFRLVQAPTFLPAYLFALTGSDFLVGLARSLQALGTVLSPFIGASMIGHMRHIKWTLIGIGMAMRLQILGFALAGFFLSGNSLVFGLMVFMTLMGFFQGMSQVSMNVLRAKVIPVQKRGIVSGMRNFLAGITSASVAYFAGSYFIDANLFGNGYGTLFLLAFVITTFGLAALATTVEPEAVSVRRRESVGATFRALRPLLAADPAFARFFIARALGSFGRMALPFYILFAGTRMELSGSALGLLTTVWMLTSSVTNLAWGMTADRTGYRRVMIITLALWAFSHLQLLFVDGIIAMFAFFVVMGMSTGGFNQAGQNMVLEFGHTEDTALRLAVSNTAINFIGTIGPVLGGLLVVIWNYQSLFILCTILQLVALAIIIAWVPEPRHRTSHERKP
jgi:MFS family permease